MRRLARGRARLTPGVSGRETAPRMSDLPSLVRAAEAVASRAHSPYSGVRVGAALVDGEGRVHLGCNVENASYSLTICAERSALARAVSDGAREFASIVIWSSTERPLMPCGACRQALAEFAPELVVHVVGPRHAPVEHSLAQLLPGGVAREDLR